MKLIKSITTLGLLTTLCAVNANAKVAEQATNMAKEAGYKSCLSTISDLENFFAKDKNYGTWSFWAVNKVDEQIFNGTIEITYSDGAHLIDYTVSPTKDGECSFTYTRSWYSGMSCIATSKQDYMSNAKYKSEVNKNVTAFDDNGIKWLLMPAGNGCMVQKKEIGFRHKKQNT